MEADDTIRFQLIEVDLTAEEKAKLNYTPITRREDIGKLCGVRGCPKIAQCADPAIHISKSFGVVLKVELIFCLEHREDYRAHPEKYEIMDQNAAGALTMPVPPISVSNNCQYCDGLIDLPNTPHLWCRPKDNK